jgi:hypothetical protein
LSKLPEALSNLSFARKSTIVSVRGTPQQLMSTLTALGKRVTMMSARITLRGTAKGTRTSK